MAVSCSISFRGGVQGFVPVGDTALALDGEFRLTTRPDAHLVALDSTSGELLWDVETADHTAGYRLIAHQTGASGGQNSGSENEANSVFPVRDTLGWLGRADPSRKLVLAAINQGPLLVNYNWAWFG